MDENRLRLAIREGQQAIAAHIAVMTPMNNPVLLRAYITGIGLGCGKHIAEKHGHLDALHMLDAASAEHIKNIKPKHGV